MAFLDAPPPVVLAFTVLFGWPLSGDLFRRLYPTARPLPF
jgi:hypothetical protein